MRKLRLIWFILFTRMPILDRIRKGIASYQKQNPNREGFTIGTTGTSECLSLHINGEHVITTTAQAVVDEANKLKAMWIAEEAMIGCSNAVTEKHNRSALSDAFPRVDLGEAFERMLKRAGVFVD
jgi:hypothetical protein